IRPLKPVNVLSITKLTTPATASEPQAADAPPVTTSTRWTTALGRVVMSTPPVRLEFTTRWPSNRTRVRLMPRLRRFSRFAPAVPGEAEGGGRRIDLGELAHIVGDVGVGVALYLLEVHHRHGGRGFVAADRNARTADRDRFHVIFGRGRGRLRLHAMAEKGEHGRCRAAKHKLLHQVIHAIPLGFVVLLFCYSPEKRCEHRSLCNIELVLARDYTKSIYPR